MGMSLQVVTGYVANPSTTVTAVAANSGESLTIPSFNVQSHAYLCAPWSPGATAGIGRIRSPRFHDAAQAIRMQRGAAVFEPLLPLRLKQPIYPSDTLTAEVTGGPAETDMLCWLQFFEDLPGVAARLSSWGDISARIKSVLDVEVDLVSGATAGTYGTARALNYSFDTFKANTDYALLGWTTSVKVAVVTVYGPDVGNQHIGGPGVITPNADQRGWFVRLSDELGYPCIPIINSNNRGSTYVQVADVAASTSVNVSLCLAELG